MSTEAHYRAVMEAVPVRANGITLCTGSLGARPDNDLPGMVDRLGERVHFLHLRNVKRESAEVRGSFYESEHLGGDVDMVAPSCTPSCARRRAVEEGRRDVSIPFRPDHGQDILDDKTRKAQPGYPAMGASRARKLRGVIAALSTRRSPRDAPFAGPRPSPRIGGAHPHPARIPCHAHGRGSSTSRSAPSTGGTRHALHRRRRWRPRAEDWRIGSA